MGIYRDGRTVWLMLTVHIKAGGNGGGDYNAPTRVNTPPPPV